MKVLLIGESCIDEYHYGICDRLCAEAPVPVFDYVNTEVRPGMASNVKENLLSYGIEVDFITNDPNLLIKRRFVDTKSNQLLMREDVTKDIESLKISLDKKYDAIVISDYCRGVIDVKEIENICDSFDGPIFVDSKRSDLKIFNNSIIKINHYEEKNLINLPEKYELIVTMGKLGARWNDNIFPAPSVDVFDVTGAGDVFLATLCYNYLLSYDLRLAISKAVFLASKSVQHMGVYKLTKQDIEST